ncbi:DUF4232 domain-containing protein [Streptomyces griseoaurantiacus]|uniref:DUF4232 domain-containing protein n=1 Tax=Streptomyces griseoaurantiacus TaxID=68213 RepID=UPI002ED226E8|nr:DUF4232 domain-containing protein [Streptomyces jietaisiensis]
MSGNARTTSRASFRTPRTRLLAAATLAVAAFALTACEDGTGTENSGSSTSSGSTASDSSSHSSKGSSALGDTSSGSDDSGADSGSSAAKGTSAGSGTAGKSGTRASTGRSAGKKDTGKPVKCSSSSVRFTASKVNRPVNHLLLTATNRGTKSCVLPAYPMAKLGDAQSVPPVVEASRPQSTVVLSPGGSGYAGVLLSSADGSGRNGYTAKTLSIPLDDGTIGTATLPSGGVFVDDSLKVTYWQGGMSDALEY